MEILIYLILGLMIISCIFGNSKKCSCGSTRLSFVRKINGVSTYKCWDCDNHTNFKE